MGVMMAPVLGSGDWPAWMARVPKPYERCLLADFMLEAPGPVDGEPDMLPIWC